MRLRIAGESLAKLHGQIEEAQNLATSRLVELTKQGNELSQARADLRQAQAELRDKAEEIALLRSQAASKDEAAAEARVTIAGLRSALGEATRDVGNLKATAAFNSFLSTELQNQVSIQRDLLRRNDKIMDAMVDGDVAKSIKSGSKDVLHAKSRTHTSKSEGIPAKKCRHKKRVPA